MTPTAPTGGEDILTQCTQCREVGRFEGEGGALLCGGCLVEGCRHREEDVEPWTPMSSHSINSLNTSELESLEAFAGGEVLEEIFDVPSTRDASSPTLASTEEEATTMEEGQEWALEIAMREEAMDGHDNIMMLHPTRPHRSSTTWESLTKCTQCRLEVGRFRRQGGAILCGRCRQREEDIEEEEVNHQLRRRRGRAMTPTRPFRAPLVAPHRPDDHEHWPMQASIDESLLRAKEESEGPTKKILPSDTLVYNDGWGSITKYTMMLAGLMLDVSAVMSALVAVIVQCFTFEKHLCGRPCRWRLSSRDDEWERACGAPCGRSCSHRADVPHCCPQHGTCDEETFTERMIDPPMDPSARCRGGGLEAC